MQGEGRQRVAIEAVRPEIDCGRYPAKRVIGERLRVEADVFADGHDRVAAVLLHRKQDERGWTETPMTPLGNDRWAAEFRVSELGAYRYTVSAWIDRYTTWRADLEKRVAAGQDVAVDLLDGAELVAAAASRAKGKDKTALNRWAKALRAAAEASEPLEPDDDLARLMARHAERPFPVTYERELTVAVHRERARYSTWYELFPRSAASEPGRHGTFADVEQRLPEIAAMGFDVLYLPPIHPIGATNRKGRNNAVAAEDGDPGSPWAIGAEEGGHTAIHPDLGTMEDFQRLLSSARRHGIDVALDIAYQATPDHPWVKEHPEFFRRRSDGSIAYAENPPKKYQDIYPINFETEAWRELWDELRNVVRFWCEHGVRIFRVDNPHTKAFRFWEWMIADIKASYPDAIFLSEAFTRPRVMYHLAKIGFDQSYTYFTWRTSKQELTEYFTELSQPPVRDFFRPHLWPNTPDILPEHLQSGSRGTFMARLVLAATLSPSYGIYGPAFELMEHEPLAPGKEEYLNSEKYEIRAWNRDDPASLAEFIARVNRARRENPALQHADGLRFLHVDNDQLIAYARVSEDGSNVVIVVVNLDPAWRQAGTLWLPLEELGLTPDVPFPVTDLLGDATYTWQGASNYVELDPHIVSAHILRVGHPSRGERDFEMFM